MDHRKFKLNESESSGGSSPGKNIPDTWRLAGAGEGVQEAGAVKD